LTIIIFLLVLSDEGFMRVPVKEILIDVTWRLIDFLVAAIKFIARKALDFAVLSWSWFISLPIIEKLIIFNGIPAMIAAMLPVARFDIFDSVYEVNNPLAHYMVLLGLLMFGTIFIRQIFWIVFVRVGVNLYYLGWAIYGIVGVGQITKADEYTITPYYSLNYIVPIIYASLAVISRYIERR
jgi:hypothetical protein